MSLFRLAIEKRRDLMGKIQRDCTEYMSSGKLSRLSYLKMTKRKV